MTLLNGEDPRGELREVVKSLQARLRRECAEAGGRRRRVPTFRVQGPLAGPVAAGEPFSAAPPAAIAGTLELIRRELGDCRRCALCRGRKNIVFGEGNPAAQIVFVGEAPGADEDMQGRPFVGRAGQLLTKIIEAMGLRRESVY